MTSRQKAAVALSLPVLGGGGIALLAGLVWGGLRCDDACGATDSDWHRTPDAWQWQALPWLGGLVLAMAILFVVFVARARRISACVALAVAATTCIAEFEWLSPDWNEHVTRHPDAVVLALGALAAAVAAIRLATADPEARDRTD
jgi:hypothetical protein